jgi:molybdate transport system substrate-binding protein
MPWYSPCASHSDGLRRLRCLVAALALVTLGACGPRPPDRDFIVAAAADLRFAMDEIAQRFQQQHPEVTVKVTYGSSGHFYQQALNGAPFDVFCSADLAYPRQLAERGFAVPGSEFQYGAGRIVIWVPASSPIDVRKDGMRSLLDPSIRHIAIANPGHAPYGKAAVAAMRSLGVYDAVESKLAYGENIAQTLQYVQMRSAEIGIVALSLALGPNARDSGRYWEIPLDAYPRLTQGGVILRATRHPDAAGAFRSFLLGEDGKSILKRFGFSPPGM